jgi:rubrerythrin
MENDTDKSRGTLESRYDARIKEMVAAGDTEGAVAYMLKAVPLIDEYTRDVDTADTTKDRAHASHLDNYGFTVTATSSKNELFRKYMAEVEGDHSYMYTKLNAGAKKQAAMKHHEPDWVCATCDSSTIFDQAQSMMVCPKCGESKAYMEMNSTNLSFNEQVSREVSSHCAYKRVNHFGTLSAVRKRFSVMLTLPPSFGAVSHVRPTVRSMNPRLTSPSLRRANG